MFFHPERQGSKRRSRFHAAVDGPSWAWYACDREITYAINFPKQRRELNLKDPVTQIDLVKCSGCFIPLIEVLSSSADHIGYNAFGQVQHGQLTLLGRPRVVPRGDLGEYTVERTSNLRLYPDNGDSEFEQDQLIVLPIAIGHVWARLEYRESLEKPERGRVWYAIVLKAVPGKEGVFQRVGCLLSPYTIREAENYEKLKWLTSGELTEVNIV